jgi:hypothetical protein
MSTVERIEFANTRVAELPSQTVVPLTSGAEFAEKVKGDARDEGLRQTVYEWHVNKLPEDQIVPASRVRQVATSFFLDIMQSRGKPERREWSDTQHRDAVLLSQDAYVDMARTHPRTMLMLASSDVTERKLKHLLDLIELRERQEHSSMSVEKKQEQVSRYFMSNFVRAALPGEEEEAVRTGRGVRGEMVAGPRPSS